MTTTDAGPYADRRQWYRSKAGDSMYRQRVYLMEEVWDKLDALMRIHGDETVNQILSRLVRDAHRLSQGTNDSASIQ